jgi:hypothetical protein
VATTPAQRAISFAADRANVDNGEFGNGVVVVLQGVEAVPEVLTPRATITIKSPALVKGWTTTMMTSVLADGSYREMVRSDRQSIAIDAAKQLMEKFQAAKSANAAYAFTIMESVARLLKEAGVFRENLAVVVDTRNGAYNYNEVTDAIRDSFPSEDSPIKYYVVVDESARITQKPGVNVVVVAKGEDVVSAVRGSVDNQIPSANIAYALTERASGQDVRSMDKHFQTGSRAVNVNMMSNFLISNGQAAKTGGKMAAPVASMLTFIRAMEKLASGDSPTIATTNGCSSHTVSTVKSINGRLSAVGIFLRIIQRIDIQKVVKEFLTALRTTSISL